MRAASEAFDAALTAWLTRQAAAEERLTSFAFRENLPIVEIHPASSQVALRGWIMATVADPQVAAFLHQVEGGGRPTAELASSGAFGLQPGDRVALAARVGVLAASGLVARDLESDRIALTELGLAALALSAAAGTGAGAGHRTGTAAAAGTGPGPQAAREARAR